jgi:hypothetical protein
MQSGSFPHSVENFRFFYWVAGVLSFYHFYSISFIGILTQFFERVYEQTITNKEIRIRDFEQYQLAHIKKQQLILLNKNSFFMPKLAWDTEGSFLSCQQLTLLLALRQINALCLI